MALLKRDRRIIASRFKKTISEILSVWVEARSDDAEIKRFHRSSPLPCEDSDLFRASAASHGFGGFSALTRQRPRTLLCHGERKAACPKHVL
jgi:hypothetical protein